MIPIFRWGKKTPRDVDEYKPSSCLAYFNRFLPALPISILLSVQSVLRHNRQNDPVENWVRLVPPAETLLVASHHTQNKSQTPPVFHKVFQTGLSLCPHLIPVFLSFPPISLMDLFCTFPLGPPCWPLSFPECSSLNCHMAPSFWCFSQNLLLS